MTSIARARAGTVPTGQPRILPVILVGGLIFGTLMAAGLVAVMGLWALLMPVYVFAVAAAVMSPGRTLAALLMLAIAIEPAAIDYTGPLTYALYVLPPLIADVMPLTISPLELAIVIASVSAFARPRTGDNPPLPLLVWTVPLVIAMGFVYGLAKGGASNLAYNEARGLIYGSIAFAALIRTGLPSERRLLTLVLAGGVILGVTSIARYFLIVRPGHVTVPLEFAFAHESSVLLALTLVVASGLLFRRGSVGSRLLLVLTCAVLLAAMIVTGRRAATLVLLVGAGWGYLALLPKRPVLILALTVPLLLGSAAYLGAYWDKEYGATAQPARAIRSQISPSARDESSDLYRATERYNIIQTVRFQPVFGVGFGRPFYQVEPLPDLTSYWPLQMYTPHQSVLWLWLKMGILGISALLGLAALAISRAITTLRSVRPEDPGWMTALIAGGGIAMFIVFASVDVAFPGTRGTFVLAALLALAFGLPRQAPSPPEQKLTGGNG